ncbi:hypothetical protein AMATHDRAFT_58672 [Amanita thiersii Skay4041]|uniref:Uncharacterized protein n=1 Tax=Amanita thiersii Skay4041 TaxID=703135 RepID=A0A2A9NV98_9AGAR|nr:hypothetical protein AMATHDRAFT_58672 [Amanita thiersii Skay4041]
MNKTCMRDYERKGEERADGDGNRGRSGWKGLRYSVPRKIIAGPERTRSVRG